MNCNKHKKVCTTLSYIEHFLILAFALTGCISVSTFLYSLGNPIEITSSETKLNVCEITAGIKKYKLINKKTKHDKILLLVKSRLNSKSIQVLIMTNSIWKKKKNSKT